MFHDVPQAVAERMACLEEIDTRDRVDAMIVPIAKGELVCRKR